MHWSGNLLPPRKKPPNATVIAERGASLWSVAQALALAALGSCAEIVRTWESEYSSTAMMQNTPVNPDTTRVTASLCDAKWTAFVPKSSAKGWGDHLYMPSVTESPYVLRSIDLYTPAFCGDRFDTRSLISLGVHPRHASVQVWLCVEHRPRHLRHLGQKPPRPSTTRRHDDRFTHVRWVKRTDVFVYAKKHSSKWSKPPGFVIRAEGSPFP